MMRMIAHFLPNPEQTGIPQLQASLAGLAKSETENHHLAIEELTIAYLPLWSAKCN